MRTNSSDKNSEKMKDTIKFFSFRKAKSTTETAVKTSIIGRQNLNEKKLTKSHTGMSSDVSDVDKKIVSDDEAQQWSYENPGFLSLPLRGSKRNKCSRTKAVINSDTFFQTKTFLYTDHQRQQDPFISPFIRNITGHSFPSTSTDSLNSSNDPEIVAALDQIASTMGLIDEKVSPTSPDPINYLLKTRSFSEKISIWKSSPSYRWNSSRARSQIYHIESNDMKHDNKPLCGNTVQYMPMRNEKAYRKSAQMLSTKFPRRTKSYSSLKPFQSSALMGKSDGNNHDYKINGKNRLKTNEEIEANGFGALFKDRKFEEFPKEMSIRKKYDNDHLTLNDRRLPLRQSPQSFSEQINSPSARYINISLSAFGYPHIPYHSRSTPGALLQTCEYQITNVEKSPEHPEERPRIC